MRPIITAICAAALMGAPAAAQDSDPVAEASAVVQNHVDAYRSGNIDRFVATFAKDATVVANGISMTGHKDIKAFYALNFGKDAPEIQIVESGVVDGRIYMAVAYIFADGNELCCSYSEYTVEDGKITYLESNS